MDSKKGRLNKISTGNEIRETLFSKNTREENIMSASFDWFILYYVPITGCYEAIINLTYKLGV